MITLDLLLTIAPQELIQLLIPPQRNILPYPLVQEKVSESQSP